MLIFWYKKVDFFYKSSNINRTFYQTVQKILKPQRTTSNIDLKMYKKLILIFVAVLLFATCSDATHAYVYKQYNAQGARWQVTSNGYCINLITSSTPFISGLGGGTYTCRFYSNKNCGGSIKTATALNGANFWSGGAWSLKC